MTEHIVCLQKRDRKVDRKEEGDGIDIWFEKNWLKCHIYQQQNYNRCVCMDPRRESRLVYILCVQSSVFRICERIEY